MSARNTWKSMIQRCDNKNRKDYQYYGGRGITVCERWYSFQNFLTDMGEPPINKPSIDRINNELGYFPENCCWADKYTQAHNRRERKTNTSGICGVSFHKTKLRWYVAIQRFGDRQPLGSYLTLFEAACARKSAENKHKPQP